MKKEIPTAEEFLGNKQFMRSDLQCETNYQLMIEFAKLHVKLALEEASKKADLNHYEEVEDWMDEHNPFNMTIDNLGNIYAINKNSILNAYPEENIK
jgi:hypothetical protein